MRAALFAALALAVAWPVLATAGLMNIFRDAQVLYSYERDAAWSVLRFGTPPLWDPYYCGGLYALGTPQSRFASPTFLLSLLFGPARGQALTLFAMILVGLEGTYRYARARGGGALGSLLAAPVFAASGVFIGSMFMGWTNFFGFQLCPWALLFFRRAVRGDARAAALAALALAWIAGFGGTYAAPFAVLLCLYELAERLLARRAGWDWRARALGLAAFAGALALAVAAVRLIPLAETLAVAPRVLAGRPELPPADALAALWTPVAVTDGNLTSSSRMYTVGAGALVLALVGLRRRRVWPLIPLALAAFGAAVGYAAGPWAPFPLLKRLPLFSALRYPDRYLIVIALVAAVAAANAVRLFEVVARRRRWAAFALAASALVLIGNAGFLLVDFHDVAAQRALVAAPPELPRPFQQARGNRWLAAFYAPMSRGSLSCWDAYPVPMSARLRGDLPADEVLADPGAGQVSRRRWSPNAIDLDVTLARPATLLVNQNFHPGWRSDVGRVRSADGLLAVDLPAGATRVALRFRPRSALAGALCTLAALLAIVWLLVFARRRTAPALIAVAAIPLALGALAYAAIPEARPVRPPARAPSGEEIVAPRPPDGATPLGARFARGIMLEAVRAPDETAVGPGRPAAVELDWRLTGPVRGALEITAAIVTPAGQTLLRADHELISAALRFSESPRDVTLRDLVPFTIDPQADAAAGFDVWVGLRDLDTNQWVPVVAPGSATERDGRLLVASVRPPP